MNVIIVGLGYVGLPVAITFAKKYNTFGFDINKSKIEKYKNGIDCTKEVGHSELKHTKLKFTSNSNDIKKADFVIVTVPTPINKYKEPDLEQLISATEIIAQNLKVGSTVIYESTVYPGTTEEICIPILEKLSGYKINKDFFVGYSPERINPGDKKHNFKNINKIVAGSNEQATDKILKLYKKVLKAKLLKVSSIRVAEASKIIENTQRDINIAFINEISKLFHLMNIDTQEVLKAASTKWNFLNFKPGLVGGHCIGIDSYYLSYKAQKIGFNPQLIISSRNINDSMAKYIVENVKAILKKEGILLENARKAKFLNDVKVIEEDYALRKMNEYFEKDKDNKITINDLTDDEEYRKKLKIVDGKIVLVGIKATEKEIEWAKSAGIKVLESSTLNINDSDEEYFLGILEREEITQIIFESTTKNAPAGAVDVSAAGDRSIVGWVADGNNVHIASDGIICAPEDSSHMFENMCLLTEIQNLELLDTSKVTNMSSMFDSCVKLTNLDLSSFNTSKVTNMSDMFCALRSLESLDLSSFNTSKVRDMSGMFGGFSSSLKSLNLSSFNTSNVTNMSSMFEGYSHLESINLSGFDTSNVTDMYSMFRWCESLESLDLSNFDTSNVTNMSCMFEYCSKLKSINLSNFNTSNVKRMEIMFNGCRSLETIDLSNFDTSNVVSISQMFWYCEKLQTIYVKSDFKFDNISRSDYMFDCCYSLVGGNGTIYDSNHTDKTYARIDTEATPGYFTLKK